MGRAAADRWPVGASAPSTTSRRGCTWCCPGRRTAACSAVTAPTVRPSPRSMRVVTRWKAESSWAQRVTPGARADRLDQGHRPDGSQRRDRRCCRGSRRHHLHHRRDGRRCCWRSATSTRRSPRPASRIEVDLTGGLGDVELDMAALAAKAREEMTSRDAAGRRGRRRAPSPRCPPRRGWTARRRRPEWADLDVDPADLVVIVGGAELGPVRFVADPLRDGGRRRTVGGRRARAGVDHRPDHLGGRPEAGLVRRRIR